MNFGDFGHVTTFRILMHIKNALISNIEGSGFSFGSGWKAIHAICPAQPHDTIVSGKWPHVHGQPSQPWSQQDEV